MRGIGNSKIHVYKAPFPSHRSPKTYIRTSTVFSRFLLRLYFLVPNYLQGGRPATRYLRRNTHTHTHTAAGCTPPTRIPHTPSLATLIHTFCAVQASNHVLTAPGPLLPMTSSVRRPSHAMLTNSSHSSLASHASRVDRLTARTINLPGLPDPTYSYKNGPTLRPCHGTCVPLPLCSGTRVTRTVPIGERTAGWLDLVLHSFRSHRFRSERP